MSKFDNVTVLAQGNVYFDGKCVSHTLLFPDGARKTVGVILPATLSFKTSAPERMDIVAGYCRVKIDGDGAWRKFGPGESFSVPGKSSFDIVVEGEPLHYVCHFE